MSFESYSMFSWYNEIKEDLISHNMNHLNLSVADKLLKTREINTTSGTDRFWPVPVDAGHFTISENFPLQF